MSQKPQHNSKRRAPADSAESDQQDADWGFDPDEANPAVEKKLGVLLVVCLLAGFGFVFYQKFRILRDDDSQHAATQAQVEQGAVAGADAAESGAAASDLVVESTDGELATAAQATPATMEVESPFYEGSEEVAVGADTDDGWNLAQTDVAQPSEPASGPTALPPLPQSDPADRFDPFAAGEDAEPAAADELTTPTPPAPTEPPTLVWDDPPAPMAPAQSEPEVQELPDINPQNAASARQQQPDPFDFDGDSSSDSPPPAETAPPAVAEERPDEPQMLITGDSQQTSVANDEEPARILIDPKPARSQPQPVELQGTETSMPKSPGASGFDPFAGATTGDTSTDETGAAALTVPQAPAGSLDGNDSAPADAGAFDPFPSAGPPPVQTEPSPATSSEPATESQTDVDPFSFPAPAAQPDPEGSSTESAFEPQPNAEPATPTWPGSGSAAEPETDPTAMSFPSLDGDAHNKPAATRESTSPKMSIEAADVAQAPGWPGNAGTSTSASPSAAAADPFSFDVAASQPLAGATPGAQPVVGEREITVTRSDSFWSISEREYGSSRYFNALARYNQDRVDKPEHLQPGMKIIIPPPEVLEDRFPQLFRQTDHGTMTISPMSGTSPSTAAASAGLFLDKQNRPRYRVGEEDTLSSIARQHLGRSSRWTEIYDLNRDQLKSPSTLTIGTVLKLPPDASGVRVAPAGGFDR